MVYTTYIPEDVIFNHQYRSFKYCAHKDQPVAASVHVGFNRDHVPMDVESSQENGINGSIYGIQWRANGRTNKFASSTVNDLKKNRTAQSEWGSYTGSYKNQHFELAGHNGLESGYSNAMCEALTPELALKMINSLSSAYSVNSSGIKAVAQRLKNAQFCGDKKDEVKKNSNCIEFVDHCIIYNNGDVSELISGFLPEGMFRIGFKSKEDTTDTCIYKLDH